MEQPRKWRLLVALDFPKREPEMVDEHGNPGLPPKLEFTSRVAPQVTTIDGVRVGIRAWSRDPLPIEITGPLHLDREIVELVLVVAAETSEEALTAAAPIVEDVVESLSFEMHYASRPIMTSVLDVTEPVAIGETRDFAQRAGFPLPAFMQSAALGHVAIADEARLPSEMSNLQRHVAAARGWYVKSLSTPYTADQFIFLWIALEILWGKSDHKTSGSFACRHGHMIAYCPTCAAPTERPVFGLGIRTFLVEESGLSEDEASQLWKARQIMHGSIPFDSAEMRDLPTRVQVLRAAVAHALKAQLGRDPGALPQVVAGGLAIDPTGTGVSGTRTIGPEDLGWPATA